eukprot:SAG31_NODE_5704_length_2371_cov_2.281250_1_plen_144_part_00
MYHINVSYINISYINISYQYINISCIMYHISIYHINISRGGGGAAPAGGRTEINAVRRACDRRTPRAADGQRAAGTEECRGCSETSRKPTENKVPKTNRRKTHLPAHVDHAVDAGATSQDLRPSRPSAQKKEEKRKEKKRKKN